ncbi:MAG: outer membrane receptor for ferrienterochelin and colicin [Algoriphagus sp.]
MAYSSYSYGLGSSLIDKDKKRDFIKSKSALTDLMLKSTLEIYPNSKSEIFLGGELTSHFYKPVNISSTYEINIPGNNDRIKAIETALFSEFNTQITPWFSLQAGLRYASFSVQDSAYNSLEPRLSLSFYPSKKTAFKFGFSKMGQFLHLLNSSSGGLPNNLWIPASKKLPFERSIQYSAGISQKIGSAWRLALDVYRKDYTNLIDYKSGQNFIINSESNYEDLVEKNGTGESYELEVMLDKSKGKFTGWLAYTYAFNNRKFDNINDGQWYAANYDRRHTLNVTGAYQVNSKVNLSTNWVFQSGRPITVPVASHSNLFINENINYPNYIYGDLNNFRTPDYHRLDINASFSKETQGNNERVLSIGVYNAYNHNNSFFLKTNYQPVFNTLRTSLLGWGISPSKNNFIPFLPYISYSIKFK